MRFGAFLFFASPAAVIGSLSFVRGTKQGLTTSETHSKQQSSLSFVRGTKLVLARSEQPVVVKSSKWSDWSKLTDMIPELNAVGGAARSGRTWTKSGAFYCLPITTFDSGSANRRLDSRIRTVERRGREIVCRDFEG
jgi:hypothetical protein